MNEKSMNVLTCQQLNAFKHINNQTPQEITFLKNEKTNHRQQDQNNIMPEMGRNEVEQFKHNKLSTASSRSTPYSNFAFGTPKEHEVNFKGLRETRFFSQVNNASYEFIYRVSVTFISMKDNIEIMQYFLYEKYLKSQHTQQTYINIYI